MCGIAGIWNYKTGEAADRERLIRITRLLAHRGPDGEGYYWGPGPGLGHRRLSIIDLEGGHQPMSNEDGTVWIVFNGEIYNSPELRHELEQRGHIFRTKSDTETIIHLYEDYREDCFDRLRGMFAVALWDQRQQRLILSRDRIGIKPLFYGLGNDGIVFGSELKCIREAEQVDLTIDATAIADLFTYFYIPGPKTIYRNAYSLEPGHFLVVSKNGIRKKKYWDLAGDSLHLDDEKQYEERLLELLHDAVQSHLLSDVPLGAFLSGGVDSGAVVALMSSKLHDSVVTCSIGFNEEEYNELPQARRISRLFKTDHQEQVVTPEPAKILGRLVPFYDQPFPDHSAIPSYYVSQLARRRVKVVLSGDGGDETFGGYSRYVRQLQLEQIRHTIPGLLRNPILAPFHKLTGDRKDNSLAARLQRVVHQLAVGSREAYLHGMTITDNAMRARLFSGDLKRELAGYDPLDVFREIYDRAPTSDPLSKIFYLDMKTNLVDDILTKVDRTSMANSLEVRVPLLDHRVVEFACSLPLTMKLPAGQRKYLLRKTLRSFLPEDHLALKKKGFRIPLVPWLRGGLHDWANQVLQRQSGASHYLNQRGVQQVWDGISQGESHLADIFSIILSFSLSAPLWSNSSDRTVPSEADIVA
jgi:asparagine synthase (glutamine-hydrolysing)